MNGISKKEGTALLNETNAVQKQSGQTLFKVLSALGFIVSIALCIYGLKAGIFTSQDSLRSFISGFGIAGAIVFTVFQAVQVVIPVMPGGLGCIAGILLFGPLKGFIYNYVGICVGSILAFIVAKHYGKPLLQCFFSDKLIAKYEKWTSERGRFAKMFTIAIFLPVAPDDFLCYMAGTTEMKLSRFTAIILLAKPFGLGLYSTGLMAVFTSIPALITG